MSSVLTGHSSYNAESCVEAARLTGINSHYTAKGNGTDQKTGSEHRGAGGKEQLPMWSWGKSMQESQSEVASVQTRDRGGLTITSTAALVQSSDTVHSGDVDGACWLSAALGTFSILTMLGCWVVRGCRWQLFEEPIVKYKKLPSGSLTQIGIRSLAFLDFSFRNSRIIGTSHLDQPRCSNHWHRILS